MKRKPFALFSLLAFIFTIGLTGCSRTVEDVASWKAKGNIEKLIKALSDPKLEVRIAAVEALGDLKAEPAVNHLAALFNDSEETVILGSVNALAAIGTTSTQTPLTAALKLDYPTARLTAATALGEQKASGAVMQLAEALDDNVSSVQLAAAVSLGQIGEESGSLSLANKLKASSTELRTTCVQSLGLTGGAAAVEALMGALADTEDGVTKAAVESLVQLDQLTIPAAMEGLKNDHVKIRSGSITVLRELKAVPLVGDDLIWYQLARSSVDNKDEINFELVSQLAKSGDNAVDTLLEAAAHSVPDFREHAVLALERIGQSCLEKAKNASQAHAGPAAKKWLTEQTSWKGAPSWNLELWSALASLNPNFEYNENTASDLKAQGRTAFNVMVSPNFKPTRAYIPLLIALLGDRTLPPPLQPDYDADGIPVVKKTVDRFRGEANQQMAKDKLAGANLLNTLPLIAAIEDSDELIAGQAAQLLGEQGEKRALQPLIKVVAKKLDVGESLTASPFYTALQKMDEPEAEPLLLKIRPNSDRAMRVFERKYTDIRPISAETKDNTGHESQPVTFRLGYIDKSRVGELMVTFAKDGNTDNWIPSPPLPEQLPSY